MWGGRKINLGTCRMAAQRPLCAVINVLCAVVVDWNMGDIVKVSASSLIFSVFKYIDMLRLVLWSPDASEGG